MAFPDAASVANWNRDWTDKFVQVIPGARAELTRFEGRIGRVVTVNFGGRAVVDFADGGWYDIHGFEQVLEFVSDAAMIAKYDATANSAQKNPARQS